MNGIGDSDTAVRVRCSRMMRETATWVGILLVSTAALFGVLSGDSLQMQAMSVLVFGIIPATAVILLAAMLVSVLKFLGSVYDLLSVAVAYGFASWIYLHTRILHFHGLRSHHLLVSAIHQVIQAAIAALIWTTHLLKRVAEASRNGRALIDREIILEIVWARQVAAKLITNMPFVAGRPIRSTARLLLRFASALYDVRATGQFLSAEYLAKSRSQM